MDRSYPRFDKVLSLRHYARSETIQKSLALKGIFGTNNGGFGEGVYLSEDKIFEVPPFSGSPENVGCPMTAAQGDSVRFYLNLGEKLSNGQPKIIRGYIQLEFSRIRPGMKKYGPNNNGLNEWVIVRPKLPDSRGTLRPFFPLIEADRVSGWCL